jgi:Txe/YoeB family toxin of Txe-Axe toxin-antitoxin module
MLAEAKDSTGIDPNMDTFDSPLPTNTEEPKEEKPDKVEGKIAKDTDQLEVNEKKEKEQEKKPEEKKPEAVEEEKPKIIKKGIKAFDGEDAYELSPDMNLRVKLADNKYENIPLKEITSKYADAVKITENAEKFYAEQEEFNHKFKRYEEEKNEITSHFRKIGELLDSVENDPMDAINYLLDLTGRNKYQFSRRVMEAKLKELDELQAMDEVERERYFLTKENAYLKEKEESGRTRLKQKLDDEAFQNQINNSRREAGVSEENFVASYNDLVKLGGKDERITPDMVIDYALSLPAVVRTESILESIDADLVDDDELVLQLSGYLRENPNITDEEITSQIVAELGYSKEVKKLNKKIVGEDRYSPSAEVKKSSKYDFESFDDFNP